MVTIIEKILKVQIMLNIVKSKLSRIKKGENTDKTYLSNLNNKRTKWPWYGCQSRLMLQVICYGLENFWNRVQNNAKKIKICFQNLIISFQIL